MNSPPFASPFICPYLRMYPEKIRFLEKEIGDTTYFIIDNSYHISDAEDEKFSNSRNSYHISDVEEEKVLHSHHLYLLLGCNNKEDEGNDIYCNACYSYKIGTIYYFCNDCQRSYHKECVESPPIFSSPCHPKYPLQLLRGYSNNQECYSCGDTNSGLVYYSSICDLFLDHVCANKLEFSAINNPKRHDHILHYFPRIASLTCNVCGSCDSKNCFYICLQCDFVVHKTCINLPRVLLISYHHHRLSFTYSLSFGNWSCGVCRRKIDENYGAYSCTKSCAYAVHSKCATRSDVWDGKELEDQPEVVYENIQSFEKIDDGIIRYFSHAHHHMRLIEDTERVFDGKQYCQACILPLYDGNVYSCMQCDFIFHEACANLPRVKHSVVHPHQLILKPTNHKEKNFNCESCNRYSCGFRYMCGEGCFEHDMDVRCASLPDLVNHPSHPHPLFIIYGRGTYQTCSICEEQPCRKLNCVECDFALCFRCASLPYKVKDEHDEHTLTLSYEKNASDTYKCQVCEETTEPKKGYYACNECGVTFHIECILGKDPYVKAGQTLTIADALEFDIIPNNRLSRPICNGCQRRCQYKIVFKTSRGKIYCSVWDIDVLGEWDIYFSG